MNDEFTSSNSQTDWKPLDAMTDKEIDFSDCPEMTAEMFSKARVRRGLPESPSKTEVTLRIDSDFLDWFKSKERDYQTQINYLLRVHMESQRSHQWSGNPVSIAV